LLKQRAAATPCSSAKVSASPFYRSSEPGGVDLYAPAGAEVSAGGGGGRRTGEGPPQCHLLNLFTPPSAAAASATAAAGLASLHAAGQAAGARYSACRASSMDGSLRNSLASSADDTSRPTPSPFSSPQRLQPPPPMAQPLPPPMMLQPPPLPAPQTAPPPPLAPPPADAVLVAGGAGLSPILSERSTPGSHLQAQRLTPLSLQTSAGSQKSSERETPRRSLLDEDVTNPELLRNLSSASLIPEDELFRRSSLDGSSDDAESARELGRKPGAGQPGAGAGCGYPPRVRVAGEGGARAQRTHGGGGRPLVGPRGGGRFFAPRDAAERAAAGGGPSPPAELGKTPGGTRRFLLQEPFRRIGSLTPRGFGSMPRFPHGAVSAAAEPAAGADLSTPPGSGGSSSLRSASGGRQRLIVSVTSCTTRRIAGSAELCDALKELHALASCGGDLGEPSLGRAKLAARRTSSGLAPHPSATGSSPPDRSPPKRVLAGGEARRGWGDAAASDAGLELATVQGACAGAESSKARRRLSQLAERMSSAMDSLGSSVLSGISGRYSSARLSGRFGSGRISLSGRMSSFDEGSGDETGALVPSGGSGRRQQLVDVAIEWPELGIKVDSLLGDGMQALPASQLLQHDQAPLMRLVRERVARLRKLAGAAEAQPSAGYQVFVETGSSFLSWLERLPMSQRLLIFSCLLEALLLLIYGVLSFVDAANYARRLYKATRAACPLECDGDGCDKSGSLGPNATAAELRVASILADQSGGGRWPILEAGRTLLRRAAVNGSSEPEAYASEIRFGGMAQLSAPDAEALQATIQSTVPEMMGPGAVRLVGVYGTSFAGLEGAPPALADRRRWSPNPVGVLELLVSVNGTETWAAVTPPGSVRRRASARQGGATGRAATAASLPPAQPAREGRSGDPGAPSGASSDASAGVQPRHYSPQEELEEYAQLAAVACRQLGYEHGWAAEKVWEAVFPDGSTAVDGLAGVWPSTSPVAWLGGVGCEGGEASVGDCAGFANLSATADAAAVTLVGCSGWEADGGGGEACSDQSWVLSELRRESDAPVWRSISVAQVGGEARLSPLPPKAAALVNTSAAGFAEEGECLEQPTLENGCLCARLESPEQSSANGFRVCYGKDALTPPARKALEAWSAYGQSSCGLPPNCASLSLFSICTSPASKFYVPLQHVMLSLALLVFIKRAIAAENMPHLIACVVVVSVAWGYELSRGEMFQQCDGEAARSAMLYEHTPDGLERTYVHAIHASLFWIWGFVAVVISVLVAFVYRHFGWQTFSVVSRLRLSLAAYRLLQWQRAATEWSIFVCLLYTAATALDTTFYRAQGIVSAQVVTYCIIAADVLVLFLCHRFSLAFTPRSTRFVSCFRRYFTLATARSRYTALAFVVALGLLMPVSMATSIYQHDRWWYIQLGLPRYVLFFACVAVFRVVLLVTTALVAFSKELARGYALREDIKRTPAAARTPGKSGWHTTRGAAAAEVVDLPPHIAKHVRSAAEEEALRFCAVGAVLTLVGKDGQRQQDCFLQLSPDMSSIRWSWKKMILVAELTTILYSPARPLNFRVYYSDAAQQTDLELSFLCRKPRHAQHWAKALGLLHRINITAWGIAESELKRHKAVDAESYRTPAPLQPAREWMRPQAEPRCSHDLGAALARYSACSSPLHHPLASLRHAASSRQPSAPCREGGRSCRSSSSSSSSAASTSTSARTSCAASTSSAVCLPSGRTTSTLPPAKTTFTTRSPTSGSGRRRRRAAPSTRSSSSTRSGRASASSRAAAPPSPPLSARRADPPARASDRAARAAACDPPAARRLAAWRARRGRRC